MVVLPPREQYLTSYKLNIPPPSTGLFQNTMFVISSATEIMNIYLNESPLGSDNWDPLPANPEIVVKKVVLSSGENYQIRTIGNVPFGVYHYGFVDTGCAYLYSAGQCLTPINSVVSTLYTFQICFDKFCTFSLYFFPF